MPPSRLRPAGEGGSVPGRRARHSPHFRRLQAGLPLRGSNNPPVRTSGRSSSQPLSAPLPTAQGLQNLLPYLLSIWVFPPQQFKQIWARPPHRWKQPWKEPSGSRLEDGPATILVPGDCWRIPSNERTWVMHPSGWRGDGNETGLSTDWLRSFSHLFNHSFSKYCLFTYTVQTYQITEDTSWTRQT